MINNETLPDHVARCNGFTKEIEDMLPECLTCLRRTDPRPSLFSMIAPPEIIAFECEYLIDPLT
jgi:hypothetical protein